MPWSSPQTSVSNGLATLALALWQAFGSAPAARFCGRVDRGPAADSGALRWQLTAPYAGISPANIGPTRSTGHSVQEARARSISPPEPRRVACGAIKFLRPDCAHPGSVRRFRAEAQILAALNHRNIVKRLDAGESEDQQPYFVMENVEGRPIDVWCAEHQGTLARRLHLFRETCEAQEMSEDIGRYRGGRPVRAHPDSLAYRAREVVTCNGAAIVAVAAIVGSLTTGLGFSLREKAGADSRLGQVRLLAKASRSSADMCEDLLTKRRSSKCALRDALDRARSALRT